jgi:peroxiredoxin
MKSPITRPLLFVAGLAFLGLAMALLIFGDALFGADPGTDDPSILPQVPQFTRPAAGVAQLSPGSSELLEVGDAASDFSLNDLDGTLVSLSDFRGRPLMLNFWATWCVPCRVEMPELQQTLQDYQEKDLAILTINQQESSTAVQSFFEEFDLSLIALLDSDGTVGRLYGMVGLPGTVFVNPDGQVTAIHRGILAREQIDDYLAETIPPGG